MKHCFDFEELFDVYLSASTVFGKSLRLHIGYYSRRPYLLFAGFIILKLIIYLDFIN